MGGGEITLQLFWSAIMLARRPAEEANSHFKQTLIKYVSCDTNASSSLGLVAAYHLI